MKNTRKSKLIALTLAVSSLIAGCGRELPPTEDTIATVETTEQTQESTTGTTASSKTTSARRTSAASSATTTERKTTSAAKNEEEEPVHTNAPASGDKPYNPGIENPPDNGGGYTPKPSGGQSRTPSVTTAKPATTAKRTTAAATTTTKAPVKPSRPSDADELLADMTLHEKVCQMFMTHPEGLTGYGCFQYADQHTYNCYDDYPIGGYIFFAANLATSDQTRNMLSNLQNYAKSKGAGVFLATDEEGGYITRVSYKLGAPAMYNMSYYGGLNDYDSAFGVGTTIGTYLADYGFNVDFAPVADVNLNPNNELGNRIFSSDPNVVADMSAAVVEGLQSRGVSGTLKHFPGLGAGGGNTHNGTVVIDRSYEQLCGSEFVAFQGGIDAGCDFVMVGHQVVTGAGDDMPADLSKVIVTDWLRDDLGFDGIAITDAQAMGAITNVYGCSEAAVLSVEAGIDIILMPADLASAVSGIENAVSSGRISEERIDESVLRILKQKEKLGLLG
ncbi:MAG: hypothetical protein K6G82_04630 [Ruminococcus sp.]|nr:hypothetical protein [Ruminococcus sp.]